MFREAYRKADELFRFVKKQPLLTSILVGIGSFIGWIASLFSEDIRIYLLKIVQRVLDWFAATRPISNSIFFLFWFYVVVTVTLGSYFCFRWWMAKKSPRYTSEEMHRILWRWKWWWCSQYERWEIDTDTIEAYCNKENCGCKLNKVRQYPTGALYTCPLCKKSIELEWADNLEALTSVLEKNYRNMQANRGIIERTLGINC